MISENLLVHRLNRALQLTNGLANGLDDSALALRNGANKSNTIGEQFWCLLGVRESYAKAIENAKWQGFSCSLGGNDINRIAAVKNGLATSEELVLNTLNGIGSDGLVDGRLELVIDLLEHEVQHHGQLIRFFYANDIPFPQKFAERYAL